MGRVLEGLLVNRKVLCLGVYERDAVVRKRQSEEILEGLERQNSPLYRFVWD